MKTRAERIAYQKGYYAGTLKSYRSLLDVLDWGFRRKGRDETIEKLVRQVAELTAELGRQRSPKKAQNGERATTRRKLDVDVPLTIQHLFIHRTYFPKRQQIMSEEYKTAFRSDAEDLFGDKWKQVAAKVFGLNEKTIERWATGARPTPKYAISVMNAIRSVATTAGKTPKDVVDFILCQEEPDA